MGADWLRGDEEYGALVRALRRKRGVGLFFVQASPAKGADILAGLREELGGKWIGQVQLNRESQDLVEPVAAVWADGPDLVWVEGVEQSLLGYEDVKRLGGQDRDLSHYSQLDVPPLLQRLNLGRERFALLFPCPVVMVVPLFVVRYLLRRAGDFFDWKSGFFEFPDENPFGEIRSFLADATFDVYEALDPDVRNRRIAEAEACLESGTLSNNEKVSLYREVGRLFSSEENQKSALLNFDKAIYFNPDYHGAWYSRGVSLKNLGRHEEAIASYDKAIEIKPDFHLAWYNRGGNLCNLGRYEESIASYDKAIEFKPDDHDAWSGRGAALNNLGRYEKAIESAEKAIQISSNYNHALYVKGFGLERLGRYEEAIATYDKAIEIQPDYYHSWSSRGDSLRHLGRYEESIASYDKALEIKPDYHYAWASRGTSLANLGRHEEAIASHEKALEIKPNSRESWSNRGAYLNNLGHYEKAIESAEKAIQISSNTNIK